MYQVSRKERRVTSSKRRKMEDTEITKELEMEGDPEVDTDIEEEDTDVEEDTAMSPGVREEMSACSRTEHNAEHFIHPRVLPPLFSPFLRPPCRRDVPPLDLGSLPFIPVASIPVTPITTTTTEETTTAEEVPVEKDPITEYILFKSSARDLCWKETTRHDMISEDIVSMNRSSFSNMPFLRSFPPNLLPQISSELFRQNPQYFASGIFSLRRDRNGLLLDDLIRFYVKRGTVHCKTKSSTIYNARLRINDDNYNDIIYMKESRDYDKLEHEYFIGYYGLNFLRAHIPNFMMTHGVVEYEGIENLVIERLVSNAIVTSFTKFEELCLYFLQVYLALYMAYQELGFMHGDMHRGNVIITLLPQAESITYRYRGTNFTIVSPFRATIIDYGRSRAVVCGKMMSSPWNVTSVLNYQRANLCVDYYRLFMTVAISFSFPELQEMYTAFGGHNLKRALEEQEEGYFYYDGDIEACYRVVDYLLRYYEDITIPTPHTIYAAPVNKETLPIKITEPRTRTLLMYLETPSEHRVMTKEVIEHIMADAVNYARTPFLRLHARRFYGLYRQHATAEQHKAFA